MTSVRYTASWVIVSVSGLLLASGFGVGANSPNEQGNRYSVAVNDPRPLGEAIRALESRHGMVITYEDPPYRHASQRVNASVAGRPPSFIPRGGPFAFEYVLQLRPSAAGMKALLAAMLKRYSTTGYAGRFQLDQTDDMFHVVPISRRSEAGQDVSYDAILSTELPFAPAGERSAMESVQALTEDLQRFTGVTVILGTVPTNLLNQTKSMESGGFGSARSHLIKILAGTGSRLSWRFLYGPNEPGRFVLNIHRVSPIENN